MYLNFVSDVSEGWEGGREGQNSVESEWKVKGDGREEMGWEEQGVLSPPAVSISYPLPIFDLLSWTSINIIAGAGLHRIVPESKGLLSKLV